MPHNELEEWHLNTTASPPNRFGMHAPTTIMTARSDTKTVTMMADISKEEGDYVYSLLKKALLS